MKALAIEAHLHGSLQKKMKLLLVGLMMSLCLVVVSSALCEDGETDRDALWWKIFNQKLDATRSQLDGKSKRTFDLLFEGVLEMGLEALKVLTKKLLEKLKQKLTEWWTDTQREMPSNRIDDVGTLVSELEAWLDEFSKHRGWQR